MIGNARRMRSPTAAAGGAALRGAWRARCRCALALARARLSRQVRASYQYTLSNFGGRLPYDWVRLHVDQERGETYVIDGNQVRSSARRGMEVFGFGDDLNLGPADRRCGGPKR